MMEFTYDGMVRYGFGFYNPNHAAALICAVMPFLWGWKRFQPLGWCLSLILTVPLAMTYSRTGMAVLILELAAFFLLSKYRNWKLIGAILGSVAAIAAAGAVHGVLIDVDLLGLVVVVLKDVDVALKAAVVIPSTLRCWSPEWSMSPWRIPLPLPSLNTRRPTTTHS